MDKLRFYTCLLVILMVGLPSFTFSQTPSQLFQQGLLKENGEGDIKAAVAIYEKIVGDATADRSLRSKALLHIFSWLMADPRLSRRASKQIGWYMVRSQPK